MTLVWGSRRSCWAWWTGEGWCFHTLGFPLASSQPPFESHQRNTYRIQRKNKKETLLFYCILTVLKHFLKSIWEFSESTNDQCLHKQQTVLTQQSQSSICLWMAGLRGNLVEVGAVDVTMGIFFLFPEREPPSAVTPGQASAAAYWEAPSARKHELDLSTIQIICNMFKNISWYILKIYKRLFTGHFIWHLAHLHQYLISQSNGSNSANFRHVDTVKITWWSSNWEGKKVI